MSQFEDLEKYLEAEKIAGQVSEEEKTSKLLEARASYIPLLQRAYAVLGDFYITILQPRGYQLYPRKKEGLTPNELQNIHSQTILFAYVANILSPISEQPYPHDVDYFRTWAQPQIGELDYHVWHPNVGLHFATILTPEDRETINEVNLSIEMRVWGLMKIDHGSITPLGIRVYSEDGGWNKIATYLSIEPNESKLEEQVETGLRLLTPNIIHHKEAFRKK